MDHSYPGRYANSHWINFILMRKEFDGLDISSSYKSEEIWLVCSNKGQKDPFISIMTWFIMDLLILIF